MIAIGMMVLSCLLFSLMGVLVKAGSEHYSIGELVLYRSLIGLLLMLVVARVRRGSLHTQYPKEHWVRSMCGAIALSLWFYSIGKLPLAMAMTLNYTAPIWMVFFVLLSMRLKGVSSVNPLSLIAVAIGFVGVILILQPTAEGSQWLDGAIGLLSGMVSAIAFLQVAELGKLNEPGYRVVFYFSLAGMILGLAMVGLEGGFSPLTLNHSMLLLGMGALAAGAQWSLTYAFSRGKTLVNASLQYLTIVFSSILGWGVFGDRITSLAIAGMALVVIAGIWAACFRVKAGQ